MKISLKVIFILLTTSAWATTPFAPTDIYPELEEVVKPISASSLNDHSPKVELLRLNRTTFAYTVSQTGFTQDGDGQNYDTKNGGGQGLWASYERTNQAGNALEIRTWVHQATFSEPSDIGGEDVKVQRGFLSGVHSWQWRMKKNIWHLDSGATILSQGSDSFTLEEKLIPHYLALGPTIGCGWKNQLGETWNLRANIAISLPVFFREYGSNSGYHQMSWHFLGTFLAEARVNRALSVTFGVIAENEKHSFKGDGERGVTDAKVSYASFAIPVGVIYAF